MVFTASLIGAPHKKYSLPNKSASSLVVSLGKTLNGVPSSLCDRDGGAEQFTHRGSVI